MSNFFTKKRVWILVGVILVGFIGFLIFRPKAVSPKESYTVSKRDVKQTVIATGSVTSQSDLSLSFKSSGVVSKVYVSVGDKVRSGQTLASLDQRDASASVAVASAALTSAKVSLNNAKATYNTTVSAQQTAVSNALSTMLNSGLTALPNSANTSSATVTISGTYAGTEQGEDLISLAFGGDGFHYSVSGLETTSGYVIRGTSLPVGNHGLYVTFSSTGTLSPNDSWTINIPNTQSSSYLSAYNAYQTALQTQSQQNQSAAGAVDVASANVDSAAAQLLVAQNNFANNLITAPISGQITAVDVKIGEQISALKQALVILDQNSLHVESNIPESSIGLVKPGQMIDMTMDALGPDQHLSGQVVSIDPASIVDAGVIDFRVVSSLPTDQSKIKPGMTVNLSIIIADKPDTLAVPNRLISSEDDKKFVTLLSSGKIHTVEIQTGLVGDSYTEIISGLSSGDTVVTLSK